MLHGSLHSVTLIIVTRVSRESMVGLNYQPVNRNAIPVVLAWAALMILTPVLWAQQPAPRPFPFMTEMEQIFRELRVQISDPNQNASSLEMVGRLKENSVAARGTMPPMIAKLPSAQQPAKLAAYKQQMSKLIGQEDELQKALRAGQNARAADILKAIIATRQEGHAQFRPSGLPLGRH
jgi:hypothetical protein